MSGKAVVSLTTGLEDPGRSPWRSWSAWQRAEQRRPILMFLTKEAARLRAVTGVIQGVARRQPPAAAGAGLLHRSRRPVPGLPHLLQRPAPGEDTLVENASLGGTVPLWEWIGDEPATTFSY
jgi:hypothetical protein